MREPTVSLPHGGMSYSDKRADISLHAQALNPRDKGFRFHAAVPQGARLDYQKQPQSRVAADSQSYAGGRQKPRKGGLLKKIDGAFPSYTVTSLPCSSLNVSLLLFGDCRCDKPTRRSLSLCALQMSASAASNLVVRRR